MKPTHTNQYVTPWKRAACVRFSIAALAASCVLAVLGFYSGARAATVTTEKNITQGDLERATPSTHAVTREYNDMIRGVTATYPVLPEPDSYDDTNLWAHNSGDEPLMLQLSSGGFVNEWTFSTNTSGDIVQDFKSQRKNARNTLAQSDPQFSGFRDLIYLRAHDFTELVSRRTPARFTQSFAPAAATENRPARIGTTGGKAGLDMLTTSTGFNQVPSIDLAPAPEESQAASELLFASASVNPVESVFAASPDSAEQYELGPTFWIIIDPDPTTDPTDPTGPTDPTDPPIDDGVPTSVPEPSRALLQLMAVSALLLRRRRGVNRCRND